MIQCKVNGFERAFDGDPEMPLLWYLRDLLQLTGTKYGCGMGLCGACTVHVNGAATRSCVTLMSSAAGKDIVTIEGLSAHGDHPVQQAWKAFNVPQCGYCQSGQIMQAVALLRETPKPTDQDIDAAMQGNICRCGTYQRIRQAIKQAAGGKYEHCGTHQSSWFSRERVFRRSAGPRHPGAPCQRTGDARSRGGRCGTMVPQCVPGY